jgi:hypothetical protein
LPIYTSIAPASPNRSRNPDSSRSGIRIGKDDADRQPK